MTRLGYDSDVMNEQKVVCFHSVVVFVEAVVLVVDHRMPLLRPALSLSPLLRPGRHLARDDERDIVAGSGTLLRPRSWLFHCLSFSRMCLRETKVGI